MTESWITIAGLLAINYKMECACGQNLVVEFQDANNMIIVEPCVHCQDEIVKKVIQAKLKQKLGLLRQLLGMVKDELHTDTFLDELGDSYKDIIEKGIE